MELRRSKRDIEREVKVEGETKKAQGKSEKGEKRGRRTRREKNPEQRKKK